MTKKGCWNYRVMRGEQNGEAFYEVHQVHYPEPDKPPDGWSEQPISPSGETMEELVNDIAWFMAGLVKPVLSVEDGSEVEPAKLFADDIQRMINDGKISLDAK